MRLNKYLSDAGICSRREADRLVQEGKILVDGKAAVLGMQIEEGQEILVNGKAVRREEKKSAAPLSQAKRHRVYSQSKNKKQRDLLYRLPNSDILYRQAG